MIQYIINKNTDEKGFNEVHTTKCGYKPYPSNQVDIGLHIDEISAVNYAKSIGWYNADGCKYCCPKAHKG